MRIPRMKIEISRAQMWINCVNRVVGWFKSLSRKIRELFEQLSVFNEQNEFYRYWYGSVVIVSVSICLVVMYGKYRSSQDVSMDAATALELEVLEERDESSRDFSAARKVVIGL